MTAGPASTARLPAVDVDDDVDLAEWCYEQGWTDGLPVVAPTAEKVAAAVAASGRSAARWCASTRNDGGRSPSNTSRSTL